MDSPSTQPSISSDSNDKHRNFPNKILRYFGVAIIAVITYLILESNTVNQLFIKYINNPLTIVFVKAIILFTVVYMTNQIILRQCYR